MSLAIEEFFGVYLLYCLNPKYSGRIYIGYTVNPSRRIKQHNGGQDAGGARRTSKRGPWSMVLIVHGFPNSIAALRFEWAWQHPHRSRRLNHVPKKKSNESNYDYHFRLLSEMLNVGPWNRLPLTIRWLNEDFQRNFIMHKCPPMHMPIDYGTVITKKVDIKKLEKEMVNEDLLKCHLCLKHIETKGMTCLNPSCDLISHVICLGKCFLSIGEYVPIEGDCPKCKKNFLWGDIVRKYKGCSDVIFSAEDVDAFVVSDSE